MDRIDEIIPILNSLLTKVECAIDARKSPHKMKDIWEVCEKVVEINNEISKYMGELKSLIPKSGNAQV